jgi:acetaldehyde dehydrogenase
MRAAILGTGNIGIDLAEKLLREPRIELVAFVGRRADSPGLLRFEGRIPLLLSGGMESLVPILPELDVVFDATSADSHREHWRVLADSNVQVIDLTPSRIGAAFVPGVLGQAQQPEKPVNNRSMVTCGGQASSPIASAMSRFFTDIDYIEISSSIASKSAGPATRANLDDYIEATENAARLATGAREAKAILVLNPVEPPTIMRTTVHIKGRIDDLSGIDASIRRSVDFVRDYVPGYQLLVPPTQVADDVITATIGVEGAGNYLPAYAGNLDIITAAAARTALDLVGASGLASKAHHV